MDNNKKTHTHTHTYKNTSITTTGQETNSNTTRSGQNLPASNTNDSRQKTQASTQLIVDINTTESAQY